MLHLFHSQVNRALFAAALLPYKRKKMPVESDRKSLGVLGMHLGLHLSINNACEYLSFLEFYLGKSIGTSSFDVSPFFKPSSTDKTGCL